MNRCPAFSTDDQTCHYPRGDGWRCGRDADTAHNHTLYTSCGEYILFSSGWYVPKHRKED